MSRFRTCEMTKTRIKASRRKGLGPVSIDAIDRRILNLYRGVGREGLREKALIVARSHPWAIDYLEQAPFLILLMVDAVWAANSGTAPYNRFRQYLNYSVMDRADADRLIRPALSNANLCGKRLHELINFYWDLGNYPHVGTGRHALKLFRGDALREIFFPVLAQLAYSFRNDELPNLIPKKRSKQEGWLRFLAGWLSQITRRANHWNVNPDHFRWLAQLHADMWPMPARDDGRHVADFMLANAGIDFTDWGLPRLASTITTWTERQPEPAPLAQYPALSATAMSTVIDYTPLPNDVTEVGGFYFAPLRSPAELVMEGKAMHHCVGSYGPDLLSKTGTFFSIRKNAEILATLWQDHYANTLELRGPRNRKVTDAALLRALGNFQTRCRALSLKDVKEDYDKLVASARADPTLTLAPAPRTSRD
jgi:hypothetical protein